MLVVKSISSRCGCGQCELCKRLKVPPPFLSAKGCYRRLQAED